MGGEQTLRKRYIELRIRFPSEVYARLENLLGGKESIEQSIVTLINRCSLCESFKQCASQKSKVVIV